MLHRDLVAVFEVASVVGAVLVDRTAPDPARDGRCWRRVLSPMLLWRQQVDESIGWWQLGWLVVTCALVLGQAQAVVADAGAGRADRRSSGGTTVAAPTDRR